MSTLTTRTAQTPVETRRDWAAMSRPERRRRVLELMQRRNETDSAARDALGDLLIAYMTHSKERPSPHTARAYRRALANLFTYWHDHEVRANDPDVSTWERPGLDGGDDYKAHLLDASEDGGRNLTPGSARVELAAVSRFYAALRWCSFTEADPLRDVHLPSTKVRPEDQRRAYTERELERLRMTAERLRDEAMTAGDATEATRRHDDLVLVLLGAHGGLRAGEMVGIAWPDVHLDDASATLTIPGDIMRDGVRVPVAKGGRPRTVVLTPALAEALRRSKRDQGEVLPFTSTSRLYRRFARLAERAEIGGGVAGRGVHALRHSSATRIYEQTGDLGQARQHLGHASISTTQRYAKGNLSRVAATLASWT